MKIILILLTLTLSLCSVASAFQGGGGETTKSKATPKKSTGSSKTVKPKPSPSKSTGPKTVRTAKVVTVKLTINVNEPKSEIFLTGKNGNGLGASGTAFTADDGSPYTIDNLRPGFYTVIIKKAGFIDFRRQIEITGKTPPVNVTLMPAVAFLSISCPGVPDAMIEIDGVGRFTGSVERRSLAPGIYSVNISRKGYLPTNEKINLAAHGDHVIRIFTLQRVPVNSLITEAEAAFERQDYTRTDTILRDVIGIEPENGRANLLLGLSIHEKGETGAVGFLLKALRVGESIAIDVNVYTDDKRMLQAKLSMDRTYLKIELPSSPNLNCYIFKPDFRSIEQKVDKQNLRFSVIRGHGDNGRNKKTDRNISVYSKNVLLRGKDTFCRQSSTGPIACDSNSINIFDLVYGWQTQLR